MASCALSFALGGFGRGEAGRCCGASGSSSSPTRDFLSFCFSPIVMGLDLVGLTVGAGSLLMQ